MSNYGADMWHARHLNRVPTEIKDQWAKANTFAAQFGGHIVSTTNEVEATCVDSQYSARTKQAFQSVPSGTISMVDVQQSKRKPKRPRKEDVERALRELHARVVPPERLDLAQRLLAFCKTSG